MLDTEKPNADKQRRVRDLYVIEYPVSSIEYLPERGQMPMTSNEVGTWQPTLLLVDDNTANLQVLRETLDGLGYKLLIAKNGRSALEIVRKAGPDLILLDIMMPEMDGYEVCRTIKADAVTRHIPVIFLTAMADAEDEARGLALGAVDYITKPINPELVRARVRNHLELKRHQDRLEDLVRDEDPRGAADPGGHDREPGDLGRVPRPRDRRPHQAHPELREGPGRAPEDHARFRDLLDEEAIELLYLSAPLHDVGKVGVRDHILLKAGRLDDDRIRAR